MNRSKLSAAVVAVLLGAGSALAAQTKGTPVAEPIVEAGGSQSLEAQREAVVAAFEPGERFAELDEAGRGSVLASFERMQALLGGRDIGQLTAEEKVALFNEQSDLNGVLTDAEADSRITCKRNRTVNSRISNTECHTVAEWDRRRERARKLMDMNKRSVTCTADSNGSFSACQ
ncbi:hypothetical protein [Chiayiivirga flava]|uniref:Uncharacterized protein n=1 Tax=Chiayiivirga flava TaxID=659595 RepID=A0A7W8D6S4_9GAMM|nr:hypothetical protein [Chiayiivirga flava]MBB5208948.1 hypothetical protein [Chiayiivirga flava]